MHKRPGKQKKIGTYTHLLVYMKMLNSSSILSKNFLHINTLPHVHPLTITNGMLFLATNVQD